MLEDIRTGISRGVTNLIRRIQGKPTLDEEERQERLRQKIIEDTHKEQVQQKIESIKPIKTEIKKQDKTDEDTPERLKQELDEIKKQAILDEQSKQREKEIKEQTEKQIKELQEKVEKEKVLTKKELKDISDKGEQKKKEIETAIEGALATEKAGLTTKPTKETETVLEKRIKQLQAKERFSKYEERLDATTVNTILTGPLGQSINEVRWVYEKLLRNQGKIDLYHENRLDEKLVQTLIEGRENLRHRFGAEITLYDSEGEALVIVIHQILVEEAQGIFNMLPDSGEQYKYMATAEFRRLLEMNGIDKIGEIEMITDQNKKDFILDHIDMRITFA